MAADWMILNFLQTHRTPLLDRIMPVVTAFGDYGLFWMIVVAVLCIVPKTRKTGLSCAISLGLNAILCNLVIKPIIARPRPFTVRPAGTLLVKEPHDYSFPSGHTSASFTVTFALLHRKDRLWIPCCILSTLIAGSRMYLYVHYPTDVLGGFLLAILCSALGDLIFREMEKKYGRTAEDSQ